MKRTDVPSAHLRRPLTLREAEAHIGRSRTRREDVTRPFHGVHIVGAEAAAHIERIGAFAPVLGDGRFFSHVSAAVLWEAQLPQHLLDGPIHVSVIGERTPPRGRGVRGHRIRDAHLTVRQAVPVVSAPQTWVQLAPLLNRWDLVAVADRMVTGRRLSRGRRDAPATTIPELARAVEAAAGARGSVALRWALARARSGVDSRRETQLRLTMVDAGLPEPDIGLGVDVGGGLVLHPDLAYARWRIVIEYEGDDHRTDRRTWLRDIERRELLEAAGYRVLRVTARDLARPAALVARIRRVIAEQERRGVPNGR